jgi:hypothetical protein
MSFLDEIDAEIREAGLDRAVASGHTPPVFDWLLSAFSYQGISDRVARSYMEKHGTASWSEIEVTLRQAPCVYRKPKPGRSDDEVRPRLDDKECVRSDRRRARPVHLSPGIDACGSHCNISCNRVAGDEGGAR